MEKKWTGRYFQKYRQKTKGEERNVQRKVKDVIFAMMIAAAAATATTWARARLTLTSLTLGSLTLIVSAECTGEDNESQKEEPGEEPRNAGVDYQELLLAQPPSLVRVERLRDIFRYCWCWWAGCGRQLSFLGIEFCI
jgi:hypothetical protein